MKNGLGASAEIGILLTPHHFTIHLRLLGRCRVRSCYVLRPYQEDMHAVGSVRVHESTIKASWGFKNMCHSLFFFVLGRWRCWKSFTILPFDTKNCLGWGLVVSVMDCHLTRPLFESFWGVTCCYCKSEKETI